MRIKQRIYRSLFAHVLNMEADAANDDPDARLQPDGTVLYAKKNGQLETYHERQRRLAHNTRMVFNRSFQSSVSCNIKGGLDSNKQFSSITAHIQSLS